MVSAYIHLLPAMCSENVCNEMCFLGSYFLNHYPHDEALDTLVVLYIYIYIYIYIYTYIYIHCAGEFFRSWQSKGIIQSMTFDCSYL
jgi:hypothetical protein